MIFIVPVLIILSDLGQYSNLSTPAYKATVEGSRALQIFAFSLDTIHLIEMLVL